MRYIVSLSGGASSAVAADLAIRRYGRRKVTLWFADTSWEDEDLYRFLEDCSNRWGIKPTVYKDGRTPLRVAEDAQIIPNAMIAPCTFELKQRPFEDWLWRVPKNVTVLLGFSWDEPHRVTKRRHWHKGPDGNWRRPVGYQARIPGVYEDYPLLWKPYIWNTIEEVKSWGIEPPRLYRQGFPHNNCGGRCIRQGQREWLRLKELYPDRFLEVRDWEQAQREKGGAREGKAILKAQSNGEKAPLSLADLEARQLPAEGEVYQQDLFTCFCNF